MRFVVLLDSEAVTEGQTVELAWIPEGMGHLQRAGRLQFELVHLASHNKMTLCCLCDSSPI